MMNYGYFNPMMTPQQRLSQLEQQYSQFGQQVGFKVLPVTNVEEANASQIDLNGNPVFFYNKGKNEVYIKQFNVQTGLADFYTFTRVENATKTESKDEFKLINDKLDKLYSILEKPKKAVKNDE